MESTADLVKFPGLKQILEDYFFRVLLVILFNPVQGNNINNNFKMRLFHFTTLWFSITFVAQHDSQVKRCVSWN